MMVFEGHTLLKFEELVWTLTYPFLSVYCTKTGPFLRVTSITLPDTFLSIQLKVFLQVIFTSERHLEKDIIMQVKSAAKCPPLALKWFLKIVPFLSNYCKKRPFLQISAGLHLTLKNTPFPAFLFSLTEC